MRSILRDPNTRGQSGHPLQRPHLRPAHPRHHPRTRKRRGLLPVLGRVGSRMATSKPHRTLLPGTLVTSQWLLARIADSERRVYEFIEFGEKQFVMLGYVRNNAGNWSIPSAPP